jgi:GNAT superfamily N-acetyltransferase
MRRFPVPLICDVGRHGQASGSVRQMNNTMIRIEALSAGNKDDFLRFFDGDAFSDNPGWSFCYCQCFYEDHRQIVWKKQTAERNRSMACRRIGDGTMRGYLAFLGDEPVGWCNAAPRHLLHALDEEPTLDVEKVGAIVCFLVAPQHRGKGIARRLLDAACDGLAAQGLGIAEANPETDAKTDAENHVGPLCLYLKSGFQIHREDDDGTVYVRRSLVPVRK